MEKIITKWYCKDHYSGSFKMQVIKDFEDGTSLCQPLFRKANGDEVSVGEKMVINNNLLFDEPLQLIRLKKDEEEVKKQKEKLKRELEIFRQGVAQQRETLTSRVKWLKNIEKESHPDKVKEMIRIMYMLIDSKNLYIFYPKWGGDFEIYNFNMLDAANPLFVEDAYDRPRMRLISICPDANHPFKEQIQFCLNGYSDGSGRDRVFKLFNDEEKLKEFIKEEYINNTKILSGITIKKCEEMGIEIPKEKLLEYYKKNAEDNAKQAQELKERWEKRAKEADHWEEKINQLTNQEE